ncbi:MAG: TIGR03546 family protein [Saccharospirillaceae bacterium]|nr:TIGR03546 family protein [Pseudomonadales bacterium]NRB81453.1 TIGR03546 family protein [Saccharospirillaceae bacterium]
MLKMIVSLLKSLSNETSPWQLAFAVSFAMIFAFLPDFTLLSIFVLFVLLSFRINLAMFLLSAGFFKLFIILFDPLMAQFGEMFLSIENLQPLFDKAYNNDVLRLFHFNQTLVMGSMLTSLLLFVPVLFLSKFLIVKYRTHLLTRLNKLHLVQMLKASSALRWFIK